MSKFDNSAFSATEGCVAEPACGVWGHCTTAWAETPGTGGYSPQLGSGHRAANTSRRDAVMVLRLAGEF